MLSTSRSTTKHQAATTIQRVFRGKQARSAEASGLFHKGVKLKVLEHMQQIRSCIDNSSSANEQNSSIMNQDYASRIPISIKEKHASQLSSDVSLNDEEYLAFVIARDLTQLFPLKEKVEVMTNILQLCFHQRDMTCDMFAVYTVVVLKNDLSLPQEIRDQIHVCKSQCHTFVCIGDPEDESSLIVDPWVNYLILAPTDGYRKTYSDVSMRDRGFLGTVKEFKEFIHAHPNRYLDNYHHDMQLNSDSNLTELTNHLSLDRIHSSQTDVTTFDFLEKLILSISDGEVLRTVLKKALTLDLQEPLLEVFLKNPIIVSLDFKTVLENRDKVVFDFFLEMKIKTPAQLVEAIFLYQIPRGYIWDHPFRSAENFIETNNLEYIRYGLANNIISLTSSGGVGNNFFHLCALKNRPEIMNLALNDLEQYLMPYEMPFIKQLFLECRNSEGDTFFDICVRQMDSEFIDAEVIPFLMKFDFDFNRQDQHGNTPLHTAILAGQIETACRIANLRDVNVNIRNNNGFTALDLARQAGLEDTMLFDLMLSA